MMWIFRGSRIFIAGIISRTEEKLPTNNALITCNHKNYHFKSIDAVHMIYGPRFRQMYLCGCPVFHSCISTRTEIKNSSKSEANDVFNSRTDCNGYINQTSIIEYNNPYNSPAVSSLLTCSELELLCIPHKHDNLDYMNNINSVNLTNASSLVIDQKECRCILCIDRRKLIDSSVLKAKRFIDDAVHYSCASICGQNDAYSFINKTKLYLYHLVHLVLAIACFRGIL